MSAKLGIAENGGGSWERAYNGAPCDTAGCSPIAFGSDPDGRGSFRPVPAGGVRRVCAGDPFDSPWEYSEEARRSQAAGPSPMCGRSEDLERPDSATDLPQPSPVAADVLDSLRRLGGRATVADLAEDTGRRPARVWDALCRLHRHKLVRRLTGGKRFFGRYGTAPQRWVLR